MDKLKSSRKQYRRLFTVAYNDFCETEKELSTGDKISKLKMVEDKAKLMTTCEYNFREALFETDEEEAMIDKEVDESEVYIDKWRVLENKLRELLNEKKESSIPISVQGNDAPNHLLHYPKIKLPVFDGNVRNWLGFWGQFQKIHKDPNLDDHDKFSYLCQAMEKGSSADELIKSFPTGGESYTKALKQLQTRYGKEELLIEFYVRDLLSIVLQKQKCVKTSLRKLYDQLETKLRALETLGVTSDKYAAMLYPLVESSLPDETLRAWERVRSAQRRAKEDVPVTDNKTTSTGDLENLLGFLQDEVEGEDRIMLAGQGFDRALKSNRDKRFQLHVPSATELYSVAQSNKKCIFCFDDHKSWNCAKAKQMTLAERQSKVEDAHCCFLCLREGHGIKLCKSKLTCQFCRKRHNFLLCKNPPQERVPSADSKRYEQETEVQQSEVLANFTKVPNVFLQTLTVILKCNGVKYQVRAIIDSGSQRSYILKSTASKLGLTQVRQENIVHCLFGGKRSANTKHNVYNIELNALHGSYSCIFEVLDQHVICDQVSSIREGPWIHELKKNKVVLSDTDTNPGPIQILIGADVCGKLLTGEKILLSCGLVAFNTRLGWTLIGKSPSNNKSESSSLMVTSMLTTNACISELWSLDSLGITDPAEKKTQLELQEAARQHFLSTVKVENDRFVVNLPWVEGHPPLADNFELSLKRLNAVIRRLKVEGLYESYANVFHEWLEEHIIEEVPPEELGSLSHYLPHRHVVKEHSSTRIRPVFDASAKQKDSSSLNDCLEKGVNLIELIPTILHRFRMERIGVVSDIRRAFLQIGLSSSDKNYLRFLWIGEDGQLKHYRHCRVVFGVSSSPFLLGIVIQHHLQNVLDHCNNEYPENVIRLLMNSFYVDNCITSVPNKRELQLFMNVATSVMAERKFDLRSWEWTNFTSEPTPDTNVLGMIWDKDADTLRVNLDSLNELVIEKVTKRVILSAAHRLFDPIGVTCPVALLPKLLLQKTWKMKLSWEEEVDWETSTEFLKWLKDILILQSVCIPRHIKSDYANEKCTLHFFCDASKCAYAVSVFIRVETSEFVKVQLIQARSRVSPTGKKETTIARLELLAATISSRLATTVMCEIPHDEVYFWTDSTTVLAWIRREESWGTFVQNRVLEIRALTSKEKWRHVPGSMNPADLPSRGCSARQLLKLQWWEGPEWLYLPAKDWPANNFEVNEEEVSSESKKKIVSSLLTTESTFLSCRFSSYQKTVRVLGWIQRFTFNCKNHEKRTGGLTVADLVAAEKLLVHFVQSESFEGVKDKRLKSFNPFYDEDGIIRMKSGVLQRDDTTDFRMPAILPSEHPLIKSLVMEEHTKKGHVGVSHVLNSLRERFWLPCGRRTVRSVLQKCVICRRYTGKNVCPVTAPPPRDRVQDSAVFQTTGVDYAGPLILRDKSKAWICLFTCAVYRAVHLELVTSLSTDAFLQAFHRFVSRRGKPTTVYSDNGTNFLGAFNALKAIDFVEVSRECSNESITWKFIPPGAPWWGGWWERLVGMMKQVLKKILGQASLNYEEMCTVLCNCEAILNDRPLTAVTADCDFLALTPADFLKDIKQDTVPNVKLGVDSNRLQQRLHYVQSVREVFRKRFRQEYLGVLQTSKPRGNGTQSVKVGDIVLVGSQDKKRLFWPLGRIIQLFPGADGVCRRARVKTQNGELVRAMQCLFPLEISSSEDILPHEQWDTISKNICEDPQHDESPILDVSEENVGPLITRSGREIRAPQKLSL